MRKRTKLIAIVKGLVKKVFYKFSYNIYRRNAKNFNSVTKTFRVHIEFYTNNSTNNNNVCL